MSQSIGVYQHFSRTELFLYTEMPIEVDEYFGIECSVFELVGGEWTQIPARSLVGFVHVEAKFAHTDGF